jgi:multidrug efflux system membrane fusion protein
LLIFWDRVCGTQLVPECMSKPEGETMNTSRLAYSFSPIALLLFVGLAGCGEPVAQGNASKGSPPPVSVAAVVEKEIVETDEFPGRIEAVEQVEVRARITGYMQSVNFQPGTEVRKGDLLFLIDPRPFENEVARAEANVVNLRAQFEVARTNFERSEKLLAERITSRREYDDAAAGMRSLEAQLRANQASLETARLNLSFTRVTAPISGRVSKAEITVGNLIQGEVPNSPLLTTVVSLNPIYASFEVDERAYLKYVGKARARAAQLPVAVGLADEEGFPHAGKLGFIDNRVDAQSGTVRMRALLDNKDGRLAPGLFARVQIGDAARPRRAVLVTDRAIGTDQSKRFVLVVDAEGKAQYREVKIGRLADGLRVIEEGLKPGEAIVVNGLQRVRPGMPVTAQTVPMEADRNAPAGKRAERVAAAGQAG